MHTYAENTSATKGAAVTDAKTPSASTGILPADNRPEAVAQREIQQLADAHLFAAPVVQRKPLSKELTFPEEKGIQDAIDQQDHAKAVALLVQTELYKAIKTSNIRTLQYDGVSKDYGRAVQDYTAGDVVDIYLEPLAFKSVPILVSTLRHEVIHAGQYEQKSKTGKDVANAPTIYGQAREQSPYITAAQEIETYSSEILEAEDIGTSIDQVFMKDRGIGLSNFYTTLFGAAKNKKRSSKQSAHLEKVKPMVSDAYAKLDTYGVDTSPFDRRGLPKGKKRKDTPEPENSQEPSNDNHTPSTTDVEIEQEKKKQKK